MFVEENAPEEKQNSTFDISANRYDESDASITRYTSSPENSPKKPPLVWPTLYNLYKFFYMNRHLDDVFYREIILAIGGSVDFDRPKCEKPFINFINLIIDNIPNGKKSFDLFCEICMKIIFLLRSAIQANVVQSLQFSGNH